MTHRKIIRLNIVVIVLLVWAVLFLCLNHIITTDIAIRKLRTINDTYLQSFAVEHQCNEALQNWFGVRVDMHGFLKEKEDK